MRVGICVENIRHGKLAERDGDVVGRARAAKLVGVRLDLLHFATEIEGLAEEKPLQTEIRHGAADLVRFAAWKGRNADRVAEAKALVYLRIDISFAPIPQAQTSEQGQIHGLVAATSRIEAVPAAVWRIERRVILIGKGRLYVQRPIFRRSAGIVCVRASAPQQKSPAGNRHGAMTEHKGLRAGGCGRPSGRCTIFRIKGLGELGNGRLNAAVGIGVCALPIRLKELLDRSRGRFLSTSQMRVWKIRASAARWGARAVALEES